MSRRDKSRQRCQLHLHAENSDDESSYVEGGRLQGTEIDCRELTAAGGEARQATIKPKAKTCSTGSEHLAGKFLCQQLPRE